MPKMGLCAAIDHLMRNAEEEMHTKRKPAHQSRPFQPALARRDARYEAPSSSKALPEEFFDGRIKLAAVCPEAALMYAVLEDAFLCIHRQFKTERFRRRAREAEDWFFSDDFRGFFSFLSVCDALGLEPHYIRTKLRHWRGQRQHSPEPPSILPDK